MKQLLYGPARRQRLGATEDTSSAMEQAQESALLSELAEGDFAADQNIVEVCCTKLMSECSQMLHISYSFLG